MSPTTSPAPRRQARVSAPKLKACSGPCGRRLPLSAFGVATGRRDGRRSECKECRRQRRGPRGKEGQRARALAKELWVLRETYAAVPSLVDVLTRALEEVGQIGATGAKFSEQVEAVRRAILVNGCRLVDEVVEDTGLSRYAVDRALERLVSGGVLETRDYFCLDDEAEESGRPPVTYHPVGTPRGEDFTHLLHRRSVDDDLL